MTNPEALTVLEKNLRAIEKHLEAQRKGGTEPDARTLANAMAQVATLVLHDLDLRSLVESKAGAA